MLKPRGKSIDSDWGRFPQGGFTLIEVIVTVSLLGLLAALGLPSFTAWIRNAQVRTVAEALQTGVRTAQAEAIRRNRQLVMSFTNTNPALNATAVAGGKNWSLQTVAQFGEAGEFVRGAALADVATGVSIVATPATNAICFNSNGRVVANASGTGVPSAVCTAAVTAFDITQSSSDRPLRVTLAIGGQVRMCDPNRPARSSTSPDGC